MKTEHFHNTPQEMYDRLVALFGEQDHDAGYGLTKWVTLGAGVVELTFFAPRVSVSEPEPVEPMSVRA